MTYQKINNMNIQSLEKRIIECLKPLNTDKIILFGSMAYGTPGQESDIDILVVTSDNIVPENLKDFMLLKMPYSKALDQIRQEFPVDLILHTKPMHQKFVLQGSSFSRELTVHGKIIYESNNQAVA
jgi:uncharacterized protein